MALPAIDLLVQSGRDVSVRALPPVLSLLEDRRDLIQRIPGGKISGVRELRVAAREISSYGFDEVVLIDRSFRSGVAAWLSGAKVRVGHSTEGRGMFLTGKTPYSASDYEIDCFVQLVRMLGINGEAPPPKLDVSDDELAAGKTLLQDATIGFQPGARYEEKRYPLDLLAVVAREAIGAGHRLALFGGPEEAETCTEFASHFSSGDIVMLAGAAGLRTAMGAAKHLRVIVGSDTGWMHVCAALETPTITMFGPNPASKWGHREIGHTVLTSPDGKMSQIQVEDVLGALRPLL